MSVATVQRDPQTAQLGMIIALGAWTMLFVTVFFAYIILRIQAFTWFSPMFYRETLGIAAINTVILGVSSYVYTNAVKDLRLAHVRQTILNQIITVAGLGSVFLLSQWYLWQRLLSAGYFMKNSIAASFFYLMTGLHAVHIVGGIAVLMWLYKKVANASQSQDVALAMDLVGYFWHFLLVIWAIVFVFIFLIR